MSQIQIVDRQSKEKYLETPYGVSFLEFLYEKKGFFNQLLCFLSARFFLLSEIVGFYYKLPISKCRIRPFVKRFSIREEEFESKISNFSSFNDFFTRKLKKGARPITEGEKVVVAPADGKVFVIPDLEQCDGFYVKGKKFSLPDFFQDDSLAKRYKDGSLCIVRLSPEDYHRFHFPFSCAPGKPKLINGALFSVNPIAVKKNIAIFSQNKRVLTLLTKEKLFVAMVEVGATNVGSIKETFLPGREYQKGEEKGYFALGGSSVLLFFEKGAIVFDEDLLAFSKEKFETKVKMGESLGRLNLPKSAVKPLDSSIGI